MISMRPFNFFSFQGRGLFTYDENHDVLVTAELDSVREKRVEGQGLSGREVGGCCCLDW